MLQHRGKKVSHHVKAALDESPPDVTVVLISAARSQIPYQDVIRVVCDLRQREPALLYRLKSLKTSQDRMKFH